MFMFFRPVHTLDALPRQTHLAYLQRMLDDDERVLTAGPDMAKNHFEKASTLMKFFKLTGETNYIETALECYNKAIELDPKNLRYLLDRAVCHINNRDNNLARADLEEANLIPEKPGTVDEWVQSLKQDIQKYLEQSPSIGLSGKRGSQ